MCLDQKKYYINQFCDALYISASYIAMNTYYYIGQPTYIHIIYIGYHSLHRPISLLNTSPYVYVGLHE